MNFPAHLMKDSAAFDNGIETNANGNISRAYAAPTTLICRIQADGSDEAYQWKRDTGKNMYTVFLGATAYSGFTCTKDCQITWGAKTLYAIGPYLNPGAADVLQIVKADSWQ